MVKMKHALKISAIVDKLKLTITNPKATQQEVGADLIMQLVTKAYKAEKEIYDLIATLKGCTIEEASEVDIVEFGKELVGKDIASFFTSAVKSKVQE